MSSDLSDGLKVSEEKEKFYSAAPKQGSNEFSVTQQFCLNVVKDIVNHLSLQKKLIVVGGSGKRDGDKLYPDIIIGSAEYYDELVNNDPPDLSKGLSWVVRSDLNDSAKG